MNLVQAILLAVALARLGELVLARRNTTLLLARGAHEEGRGHYPLIVALHAVWLGCLFFAIPLDAQPLWGWLALFLTLQAARVWVIVSMGEYWTTRIIILPGAPLVRRGPYRWLHHPNYLVVAGEIAVLPLAFDAWRIALAFTLLNGAMLAWRIRIENNALAPRRRPGISH